MATPQSGFLRRVRGALVDDFRTELDLALRVAVLEAAGHKRAEIAQRLGVDPLDVRAASARLRRAAHRLEIPDPAEGAPA